MTTASFMSVTEHRERSPPNIKSTDFLSPIFNSTNFICLFIVYEDINIFNNIFHERVSDYILFRMTLRILYSVQTIKIVEDDAYER